MPIKALEITVEGQRVCTAGLPEFGVVTCILDGRRRLAAHTVDGKDEPGWTYEFRVGGVHGPEPEVQEFLEWHESELQVGQEVVVRLVEIDEVDEPAERRRETKGDVIEQKRKYLEHLKRQIAEVAADLELTE